MERRKLGSTVKNISSLHIANHCLYTIRGLVPCIKGELLLLPWLRGVGG